MDDRRILPGENPDLLTYLSDPRSYSVTTVDTITTHASRIFLAGDRAYKLKRPVYFPFMDYSTLARRKAMVHEELRINQRTAPELYLGVEAVIGESGRYIRCAPHPDDGDDDRVVDWLLVMQRFDQRCLLSTIAEQGMLEPQQLKCLRDAITTLHRQTPDSRIDWLEEFRWVVRGNADELIGFADAFSDETLLRRVTREVAAELDRHEERLARRAADGLVRRCHGDLHLGNAVWLDNRVRLFDAVEFNPRLATIDTLYDSAFILMDLCAKGMDTQAFGLLTSLTDRNDDEEGLILLPLYLATRALVRSKIDAGLASQEHQPGASTRAEHYLREAKRHLVKPPPRLIAIGGLSGSGKSTVAGRLGPELGPTTGARWLRSDVLRKRQAGVDETTRLPGASYTREASQRVYEEMFQRAARALGAGQTVILDAVFIQPDERQRAADLATKLGVPFDGFWLSADLKLRKRRVAERTQDASDADVEVVVEQEAIHTGAIEWCNVDSDDQSTARIQALLAR